MLCHVGRCERWVWDWNRSVAPKHCVALGWALDSGLVSKLVEGFIKGLQTILMLGSWGHHVPWSSITNISKHYVLYLKRDLIGSSTEIRTWVVICHFAIWATVLRFVSHFLVTKFLWFRFLERAIRSFFIESECSLLNIQKVAENNSGDLKSDLARVSNGP